MNYNQEGPGAYSYQPANGVHGPAPGYDATGAVSGSIAPMAASVPPMSSTADLEMELAALAQGTRQKRRSRFFVGTSLLVVAAMAVALNVFAEKVKAAEAGQAEAVAARIAEQDRIAQLNLQIQERDKKIADLNAALDAARSDVEKAQKTIAMYKASEEARVLGEGGSKAAMTAAVKRGGAAAPGKAARSAAKKGGQCVCKQGDPLCGCL